MIMQLGLAARADDDKSERAVGPSSLRASGAAGELAAKFNPQFYGSKNNFDALGHAVIAHLDAHSLRAE